MPTEHSEHPTPRPFLRARAVLPLLLIATAAHLATRLVAGAGLGDENAPLLVTAFGALAAASLAVYRFYRGGRATKSREHAFWMAAGLLIAIGAATAAPQGFTAPSDGSGDPSIPNWLYMNFV